MDRLRTLFDGAWMEYDTGWSRLIRSDSPIPSRTALDEGDTSDRMKDAVVVARGASMYEAHRRRDGIRLHRRQHGLLSARKITRGIERALATRRPMLIVSARAAPA